MELLQEGADVGKKTFFTHVFDTSAESNAEILNVTQYALLGLLPVLVLNKLVQRFVPEADPDKSSIELSIEVLLQTLIMFIGILFIHRVITYVPTYSGFRYEHLTLTNVVLAFLVIVLSLQTKLGIKVNILYDRVLDLWNGTSSEDKKQNVKRQVRFNDSVLTHNPSQADYLDGGAGSSMFPPAPVVQSKPNASYDHMMRGGSAAAASPMSMGPAPANAMLGGSFGAFF
jgi:hypothetical protein